MSASLSPAAEVLRQRGIAIDPAEAEHAAAVCARTVTAFRPLAAGLQPSDDPGVFLRLIAECRRQAVKPGRSPASPPLARESFPDAAAVIDRAKETQQRFNAFIEIFGDRLRKPASQAGGPLQGLPFAYKDVFATPGRLPTVGIGHGHRWHGPQSTVIDALERAGAVSIGATNLDPWCYIPLGLNPDFGRVRHPLGDDLLTGGSSSGSAVAVATGTVPFALGTDTGGSVRIPAALCGIYGMKTTQGLLADSGVAPLSFSQDTIGILGAEAAVLRAVLQVLAPGLSRRLWSRHSSKRAPLSGLRVGLDPAMSAGCDPDVDRAMRIIGDRLHRLGAEIVDARLPPLDELSVAAGIITAVEAGSLLASHLATRPEWVPAMVRRRVLPGLLYSGTDYADALRLRGVYLRAALAGAFTSAHLVLAPVVRREVARMDEAARNDEAALTVMSLEVLRLNRPISLLGLPSLAFPALRTEAGHPIGLQLIGPPFADAALLDLAADWQSELVGDAIPAL